MLKFLRWLCSGRESGQALIFVAVCAPVMIMFMGLALEGGRAFVEFRRMQSAADMAALVGAENLPNHWAAAVTDACGYAGQNMGIGSAATPCGAVGTTGVTLTACVPPAINSPYPGFIRYGRANSSCSTPQGQSFYVDVQIQRNLSVPIFNQTFTISAHAVARNGGPSPKDFAIAVLNHTMPRAMDLSGSRGGPLVVVGPIIANSTAADSIYTGGSSLPVACDGGWFTSANETYPPGGWGGNLRSVTGGNPIFAPPDCEDSLGAVGNYDTQTAFFPQTPPIADPYGTSNTPAMTSGNCAACQDSPAKIYMWTDAAHRDSGTWTDASTANLKNGNFELFPGTYPNGILADTGANLYLNPGVYTITSGGFDTKNGSTMCIYGAPACDSLSTIPGYPNANCQTATFLQSDPATGAALTQYVPSSTWYYYCSPWGKYDTDASLANRFIGRSRIGACSSENVRLTPSIRSAFIRLAYSTTRDE